MDASLQSRAMVRLTAVVPATNDPPTLGACLDAISGADQPPEQVVVVTEGGGPADARNAGVEDATGDVVVFVDADVLVHADAFARIREAFDRNPELAAVFGSYDDEPAYQSTVSQFRNLLHHHVHQQAAGEAKTFWTGLGAVRRPAFAALGGFDASWQYMEDVDFGMRLHRAGARIVLDPSIQGTHMKAWTLATMVRTDFSGRAIPWVELLLRDGSASSSLNLAWRHRASAMLALLAAYGVVRPRPSYTLAAVAGLATLNRRFYGLLLARRGPAEAAAGVGLHVIHHVTSAAAIFVVAARRLRSRSSG